MLVSHLDGLSMLTEYIHSDNSFVELWVSGLNDLVMLMLRVANRVKTSEHKLKQRLQILRRG